MLYKRANYKKQFQLTRHEVCSIGQTKDIALMQLLQQFYKKGNLENFAKFIRKHLCQSDFFKKKMQAEACNFINNETLAHVFFSEFCEIFKNIFLTEHLQVTVFNSFNKAISTN